MSCRVSVTAAARLDVLEAAAWYEQQGQELAESFRADFLLTARRLEQGALWHSPRFLDVRRAPLRRFEKYGVFYIVRGEEVVIFAVMHGSRRPGWVHERRRLLE